MKWGDDRVSSAIELTSQRPIGAGPYYTFSLGPGKVLYLRVSDFLRTDVEILIDELRKLANEVQISAPWEEFRDRAKPYNFSGILRMQSLDSLFASLPWDERLRIQRKLGEAFSGKGLPSSAYCCFHLYLRLQYPAVAECLEAWVAEALDNRDLINSYRASPDHIVVKYREYSGEQDYVFRLTDFVIEKLKLFAEQTKQQQQQTIELEEERQAELFRRRLEQSRFDSFVYLMEDLRNGLFKIGRSKTPGKRERTLQSEQPSLILRFSIPAAESDETELHRKFASKRSRGEWFSLTETEIISAIAFLKKQGDLARVSVDHEWLGKLFIRYEE